MVVEKSSREPVQFPCTAPLPNAGPALGDSSGLGWIDRVLCKTLDESCWNLTSLSSVSQTSSKSRSSYIFQGALPFWGSHMDNPRHHLKIIVSHPNPHIIYISYLFIKFPLLYTFIIYPCYTISRCIPVVSRYIHPLPGLLLGRLEAAGSFSDLGTATSEEMRPFSNFVKWLYVRLTLVGKWFGGYGDY